MNKEYNIARACLITNREFLGKSIYRVVEMLGDVPFMKSFRLDASYKFDIYELAWNFWRFMEI